MREKIILTVGKDYGSMRIIECATPERTRTQRAYWVRDGCCDTIRYMSHKAILTRLRKNRTKCHQCAMDDLSVEERVLKRRHERPKRQIYWPVWIKPPSIPKGHHAWMDRMGRAICS